MSKGFKAKTNPYTFVDRDIYGGTLLYERVSQDDGVVNLRIVRLTQPVLDFMRSRAVSKLSLCAYGEVVGVGRDVLVARFLICGEVFMGACRRDFYKNSYTRDLTLCVSEGQILLFEITGVRFERGQKGDFTLSRINLTFSSYKMFPSGLCVGDTVFPVCTFVPKFKDYFFGKLPKLPSLEVMILKSGDVVPKEHRIYECRLMAIPTPTSNDFIAELIRDCGKASPEARIFFDVGYFDKSFNILNEGKEKDLRKEYDKVEFLPSKRNIRGDTKKRNKSNARRETDDVVSSSQKPRRMISCLFYHEAKVMGGLMPYCDLERDLGRCESCDYYERMVRS